jgi:methionyl aminopeptidase
MPVVLRSPREIDRLRRSGQAVRLVLEAVREAVKPGATTMDLERIAVEQMKKLHATPAFKGYHDYPCALCTSVNQEVVHGIPSDKRVLKDGDIVSLDTGVVLEGYFGDSAITVPVGSRIDARTERLIAVTQRSLERGIEAARAGARMGDIGAAVQEVVEAEGFSIVREFVGHGIGTNLHEEPQVPNWGKRGHGMKLKTGMVFAIEPMVNAGHASVKVLADKWTAVTMDGSLSAHFEHCIAITQDGPQVLTN